jgi:carbamoyltransferase
MIIWGISANSHDASITVVQDQKILFAGQSERYSGVKNDAHLNAAIVQDAKQHGEPDLIVWYEKPWLKSLRQLHAGQGWVNNDVRRYLNQHNITTPFATVGHHTSHAAGGYYTSPFEEAAVLVIDAIGEFDTTTIWHGQGKKLEKKFSIKYPHSLGLWYSAMTQRVGLKPNEEEYILMGMAAYGDPLKYTPMILEDFFDSRHMLKLNHNLHRGCMWWRPELNTQQDKYDIAAATQFIYEMSFHDLLDEAKKLTGSKNLVLGGGCALNCVANSIAFQYFEQVWIMPNPGDAGNSLGAIAAHQQEFLKWETPYLGYNIEGEYPTEQLLDTLKRDKIAGVASGRAEFGPRALGHRSLLADPRGDDIKDKVNAIKKRQKFRPFAPAILVEHAHEYFHMPTTESPYMQYTALCKHPLAFPAIIHADGTSRVQTVSESESPAFYEFLQEWYRETGCPMVLNTSLNIKGKPMVNDQKDAQEFTEKYSIPVYT